MDRIVHTHTCRGVSVRIEVDPNRVEHTSPERFDDDEKIFMIRYPKARVLTEIIAMAASPLIFAFSPERRSNTAHMTVTGSTSIISFVNCMTVATDIAPKATCDNPSPIKENLLRTSVTPRSDEHNAIRIPTIIAYLTNGY